MLGINFKAGPGPLNFQPSSFISCITRLVDVCARPIYFLQVEWWIYNYSKTSQARSQLSGNGGEGVVFHGFWTFYRVWKLGVPGGCLGETSIFKRIIIDDVTLW